MPDSDPAVPRSDEPRTVEGRGLLSWLTRSLTPCICGTGDVMDRAYAALASPLSPQTAPETEP